MLNTLNNKITTAVAIFATAVIFWYNMTINIDGIKIEYIKKAIKSIRLKIDRDGNVVLISPKNMPDKFAFDFCKNKIEWVKKNLKIKEEKLNFTFSDGEKFFIFGKAFTLRVVLGKNKHGVILDDEVIIFAKDEKSVKSQFEKYLKDIFYKNAQNQLNFWADITGLKYLSLTVRKTVSVWGSCNSQTGAINLSVYLAFMPLNCLRYVALHEICHLRYANHGSEFKNMMDFYMPSWKEDRKFLNENRRKYVVEL